MLGEYNVAILALAIEKQLESGRGTLGFGGFELEEQI